jgi:ABC-type phosphate/phosphonate transport system substrate-binding protein
MIASLPMYDFPEIRHVTDALWQGLARHFRLQGFSGVPNNLVHDSHLGCLWSDSKLFLSQCCGYDVVHRYKNRLHVLATPWFAAPGCNNGDYASIIVVGEDSKYQDVVDMFGTVAVINGAESHSGMNALFALVAPCSQNGKFFSEVKISGSHASSLDIVKTGKADVASVDCVTYELLRRYRPYVINGTRPLGLTCTAPSPPYVTRVGMDMETVTRMKTALTAAFADPSLYEARQTLLLDKLEISDIETYHRITTEFRHDLRAV